MAVECRHTVISVGCTSGPAATTRGSRSPAVHSDARMAGAVKSSGVQISTWAFLFSQWHT